MPDPAPTLLLTRPQGASDRFLAALRAAGATARAIVSPLIDVEFVPAIRPVLPVSALILTSQNGAAAAARMGFPPGTRAWCVGDQTARAARQGGLVPASAQGDAEALVALILHSGEGGPLLHLRGEHARGDIVARLSARGVPAQDLVVYRQHERPLTPDARAVLTGTASVVAPLFSPRTAAILAGGGPFRAPLTVVAISRAVAAAAAPLAPRRVVLAEASDGRAMRDATIAALDGGAVLETGGREG